MKFIPSTLFALATLAAAAPTEKAEGHPQLVHIRESEAGWHSSVYRGDLTPVPADKEVFARDSSPPSCGDTSCRAACSKKDITANNVRTAQTCLINSLDSHPKVSRLDRGVAYCRSGNAVVALCATGPVLGAPLKSDMVGAYNRFLDGQCSSDASGSVWNADRNTTYWRGAVGDSICPGMKFSGKLGQYSWTVDINGPTLEMKKISETS